MILKSGFIVLRVLSLVQAYVIWTLLTILPKTLSPDSLPRIVKLLTRAELSDTASVWHQRT